MGIGTRVARFLTREVTVKTVTGMSYDINGDEVETVTTQTVLGWWTSHRGSEDNRDSHTVGSRTLFLSPTTTTGTATVIDGRSRVTLSGRDSGEWSVVGDDEVAMSPRTAVGDAFIAVQLKRAQ